jgi:hypothetical protein
MRRLLACLLVLASGLAGCGGTEAPAATVSAAEAVRAAQRSLDDRKAGRIEFSLLATAEGSDPVGFEIEGDYSFERSRDLAVLDLTYRQVLGEESAETQIISDGDEAWVVADEESTKLTAEQAQRLEVGQGGASTAVPAMDLAAWLRDGEMEEAGDRATVTGEVNASAFIADLQTIAAQVAGVSGGELTQETAAQIDRSLESSSMEIVTEKARLRSVEAEADFGTEVPRALREALGSYAGASLHLKVTVDDIDTPLEVDLPT